MNRCVLFTRSRDCLMCSLMAFAMYRCMCRLRLACSSWCLMSGCSLVSSPPKSVSRLQHATHVPLALPLAIHLSRNTGRRSCRSQSHACDKAISCWTLVQCACHYHIAVSRISAQWISYIEPARLVLPSEIKACQTFILSCCLGNSCL